LRSIAIMLFTLAIASGMAHAVGPASAQTDDGAATIKLAMNSSSVLVLDQDSGQILYGKNAGSVVPIASITKLMTAVVVFDAKLDLEEQMTIAEEDIDWLRNSHSRLPVGTTFSRDEMLRLALMASENRAASALSRYYPGGRPAFIEAMNAKAQALGMSGTRYADSTGLSSTNVSTAQDLAKLVRAAHGYPKVREYSTASGFDLTINGRRQAFRNTNALVRTTGWDIGLSKTGFINEAGRCLVMQVKLAGRAVIIVLLDSWGKYSRIADANRIRKWMENAIEPVKIKAKATVQKHRRNVSTKESRRHRSS
jgi:D-alanyl-D-alanine endopeptidase (penicillin-binding protein 7)